MDHGRGSQREHRGSQREHEVRFVKNVLIPMSDGTTLSAALFMPVAHGRYPAVFNYCP